VLRRRRARLQRPEPVPARRFITQAAASPSDIALVAVAVVVAWRRRRPSTSQGATFIAPMLPTLAAMAANRLAEIPLIF
jgi:hypothetical protein